LPLQDEIIKTSGIEFTGFCRKIRVDFYRSCQSRDKCAHYDLSRQNCNRCVRGGDRKPFSAQQNGQIDYESERREKCGKNERL